MKKHNREQENSKPEKHSWFKSKKDEVKQEAEEEVSEVTETVAETVDESVDVEDEKSTETATNEELVEEVAESVAVEDEKATETATNDEIVEKVAESVAVEDEKSTETATNGELVEDVAESVDVEDEKATETATNEDLVEKSSEIVPVVALSEKSEDTTADGSVEEEAAEEITAEEAVEEAEVEKAEDDEKTKEETDEKEIVEEDKEEDEESEESEETEEESEDDEDDETDKKAVKAKKKDKEESQKEKSALYMFFDTVKFVAIGLLIGILLVVFVIQRNDVYGSSMEPTLYSGDAVFVEMISVYTGNFDRGDIITIDAKGMEGYSHDENLIKRIVGLPGETIKIADGNVYINGQLLDESDYLPAGTKTYVGAEGQSRGYDEMTLGPDEYYCMGDNRGGSNDSRRMGPFKKSQIDAKVLARIYPFNKMKFF